MTRQFGVVTGASRGIGAEYARGLAAMGYDLLLVGRDKARLDALSSELSAQRSVSIDHEVMDLSEEGAAHRLYAAARSRRDRIDLVVNNAGFGMYGSFVDMPLPRVQEMLRLHVDAVVESIRLFLPSMLERKDGAIITVASTAGFFPLPFMAEYAATKAFLISFSLALAEEVRSCGVRIQVCCPGSTRTDFHATAGFRPANPLGRDAPARVVKASLRALRTHRVLVTVGWRGGVMWALSRCLPPAVVARVAGVWLKRGLQEERP
jgi:short-subunit dehydrogenase